MYELFKKIVDNKQEDQSLSEFYSIYKGIINKFHELLSLTTDLDNQRKQWKDLVVCGFLMNLNENYDELMILSLKSVFSRPQTASLTISPLAMTSTDHFAMTACDGCRANKGSHGHP